MRNIFALVLVLALAVGGTVYYRSAASDGAAATPTGGGGRGRGGPRQPMTVDTAVASRHEIVDYVTVVGNLIGQTTVDIVPRVAGRMDSIAVKLGDRVSKGQQIAKVEDREILQQISQAEAGLAVNQANVTQRENDEQVRLTTLQRQRDLYKSGLTSTQNLEDAQAQHNAAVSQVLVAKSQQTQTEFRVDELKITLSNTTVVSPVDGFVARRNLDPGGFAGANTVIMSIVEISTVRLVASLVERDFKRVQTGVEARVEVDAFPGEQFRGQVSRVAPVFDPATRTATMEIEVPNPGFRLKPGMYARVRLTVERRPNALTVPRNALVDVDSQRGVFLIEEDTARFQPVTVGLQDADRTEIVDGLTEGQRVITTGALALRDGDRVLLASEAGQRQGGSGREGGQPPTGRE
jgi:RND family efflux transporter MFP subunit